MGHTHVYVLVIHPYHRRRDGHRRNHLLSFDHERRPENRSGQVRLALLQKTAILPKIGGTLLLLTGLALGFLNTYLIRGLWYAVSIVIFFVILVILAVRLEGIDLAAFTSKRNGSLGLNPSRLPLVLVTNKFKLQNIQVFQNDRPIQAHELQNLQVFTHKFAI